MKKKYYLTLDTETTTFPFVKKYDNAIGKNIAIAFPIIYDIGWVITDRQGNVVTEKNYLVSEVFFNIETFSVAHFANKRDIYLNLYHSGKIKIKHWEDIRKELMYDISNVDLSVAYNACFDFKKALPTTDRYIKAIYSNYYLDWLKSKEKQCDIIAKKGKSESNNPDYLVPTFEDFPIADLWGLSCQKLLNTDRYRKFCIDNSLYSPSGKFYSTTAEACYKYLMKNTDFKEAHTALKDAKIEAYILSKLLKKGKVEPSIIAFPFRILGRINPEE